MAVIMQRFVESIYCPVCIFERPVCQTNAGLFKHSSGGTQLFF